MRKFYIVFARSECTDLLFRFIHKTINHVYIMEEIPVLDQKILVVAESRLEKMDVGIIFNTVEHVFETMDNISDVIVLETDVDSTRKSMFLEPFTCVACTKRILGIFKRWILTPKQLHSYLLANGGKRWAEAEK